ncbi:MAG: hypothetical protein H6905_06835 [Hyphomicrobiales bacterium]|nr:hypothetical protein [Hyphomicrobiales bacterium]
MAVDPAKKLATLRQKITALQSERMHIEQLLPALDQIDDHVCEFLNRLVFNPAPGGFARSSRGAGLGIAYDVNAKISDIIAVLRWLFPGEVDKKLRALVADHFKDAETMAGADKAARLSEINSELLTLEFEEEALIEAANADGLQLTRRADANPAAVLGVESAS